MRNQLSCIFRNHARTSLCIFHFSDGAKTGNGTCIETTELIVTTEILWKLVFFYDRVELLNHLLFLINIKIANIYSTKKYFHKIWFYPKRFSLNSKKFCRNWANNDIAYKLWIMFEFSNTEMKSSTFHKIFIWRIFDNLCKERWNRLEDVLNHGNKLMLKAWKVYKDFVKLKFNQEVYCAEKWNHHTVNTNLISSNVFALVEIFVVVANRSSKFWRNFQSFYFSKWLLDFLLISKGCWNSIRK